MFKAFLLSFLLLASATSSLQADCCGGRPDSRGFKQNALQRDYPILYESITTKRSIPVNEKSKNLSFSGDLRSAWAHLGERNRCGDLRGNCAGADCPTCEFKGVDNIPYPSDVFGTEFNFYVDYVQQCAWGVVWVQYSNSAGLVGSLRDCSDKTNQSCRGSGTCDELCLRKAYLGYNVLADGCTRIDLEIGRRPLWSVFDSRVQFDENFDGALLKAAYNFQNRSDLYMNVAGFVVDERAHHWGFVGESGFLNMFDTGLDLKYSLIDWTKGGANRCGLANAPANQYTVSQITGYYNLDFDCLWNNLQLYGAVLFNTAASNGFEIPHPTDPDLKIFHNRKENFGWYAGFVIGQVCKEGDWALDVNYQYVEPRTIPAYDLSGIGSGNLFGADAGFPLERGTRANYQGWRFEGLYAFTDNFIIDVLLQFATPAQPIIGGSHSFSQFQLEAIYAF